MNSRSPAPRPRGRRSWTCAAALVLPLAVVVACDTAGRSPAPGTGGRPSGSPTAEGTPGGASPGSSGTAPPTGTAGVPGTATVPGSSPDPSAGGGARSVRTAVYFLHGEYVSPAPRTVAAPGTAAGAVRALLAGPNGYERAHGRGTAIPSGTALRSLVIRDRVATVDLSGRYDDGGGSLSLRERLAQVVFTVTRFPSVDRVRFALDGTPVEHFGGEGIVLDRPVGRADFEDVAPAVLVDSPLLGDTVGSPLRVRGSADTFEAVFRLKVTDVTGRTAADVQVRATSGTGTRGTFDVTFPCKPRRSGPGLLTAYFDSPADGRPVTVDTVPLTVRR
ncbi:GerMN domain-containing protein [Streptomyces actuosus]|uniref:GerMN domain-containing protein n=1 Tax=Streptomyces actuosus TaxID=1885 RepID=A0ABS2VI42_STRAS|nr:Gmad2 immunoglobulin-like domain-containing protein [Streptomyces actuosus]MBN0042752.1 GerMN domain-containing protein [Streptomyces actuosus]